MDSVFTYCFYAVTVVLLSLSFINSKKKTILALKKSWRMFFIVLPQFVAVLSLVGNILAITPPEDIKNIIGMDSGLKGILLSALLGSIAIIPVLIAFPIANELLQNGAGLVQITVFIYTLTTVGFVTMSLEMKYLGRKVALLRNLLEFIFSFIAAFIIGGIY